MALSSLVALGISARGSDAAQTPQPGLGNRRLPGMAKW
jgi:hypothetical protein